MQNYQTVVIGGGAAGICAAISKARAGESVVICEKMSQLGKKILATGNGRCNLLNDILIEAYYNAAARPLVRSIFSQFGKSEITRFSMNSDYRLITGRPHFPDHQSGRFRFKSTRNGIEAVVCCRWSTIFVARDFPLLKITSWFFSRGGKTVTCVN